MNDEKERVLVCLQAETPAALRDAITLLRLGAGDLLTGEGLQLEDAPPAFIGTLEIDQLPNPTPFLLALIRNLLLAPPTERTVATIAGRIWLSSHCSLCGRRVDQAEQSANADVLCQACDVINSQPGGLGHLARMEQIRLDQQTIMAFLKDPTAEEGEKDQFYLLMMAGELAKLAREGFKSHGRGAILLDQTGDRPFNAFYVDQTTAETQTIGWPNSEVERWVKEYDPLKELIIVFLKPGNHPATYRMPLEPDNWFNPGDRGEPPKQAITA